MATDGQMVLVVSLDGFHGITDGTSVALSPEEFQKILLLQGSHMEFFTQGGQLWINSEGMVLQLATLSSSKIPDFDHIERLPECNQCENEIDINFLTRILNFCVIIGESSLIWESTGEGQPITVSGSTRSNWKIIFMPKGIKQ